MLVAFDLIMLTIDQRQEKVREIFSERFDEFADKKNQDNFAELFKKMFLKEIPQPEKE
jgi:Mg/Co/Ni transporter MgtE